MAKFKKYLLLSFGLAFVLLAALAVNARSGDPKSPEVITFQTPYSKSEPAYSQLRKILDVFQYDNPDVEVLLLPDGPRDVDVIVRRIIANKAPDMLELSLDNLANLASRSFIVPLEGVLPEFDRRVFSYVNEVSRYQGILFAAPYRACVTQLIYNQHVLNQAGFLPDDPLLNNWPEMLQTCSAIQHYMSSKNCYPIAIAGRNPQNLGCLGAMLFAQTQAEILDVRPASDDKDQRLFVSVNDEPGIRALKMLKLLGSYMPPDVEYWSREKLLREFIAEHVAMFYGTASDLTWLRSNAPSLKVNAIEAPRDRESASCIKVFGAAITSDSQHKKACKRLAAFLCSQKVQDLVMTGGEESTGPEFAPIFRSSIDKTWYQKHPQYKPFVQGMMNPCRHYADSSFSEVQRYVLAPELYKLLSGEIDAEAAAEHVETSGKAQLATYFGYVGHASETTVIGMSVLAVCVFFLVFFTVGHRSKE